MIDLSPLPGHKTKIVATIGPASLAPEMMERLVLAGVGIARLNFSHGDFQQHGEVIANLRAVSKKNGRRIAIMADLPGPKMRLGTIEPDSILLEVGDPFTLTSDTIIGNARRVSMSFEPLPRVVKPGDRLFLNDGLVQLIVSHVEGNDVQCTVSVGGELRSRKGLNLPGIKLGISAFTERDRECLKFAISQGVDAVSQSFVESADDINTVRAAAQSFGGNPFIIAKVERIEAIERYDEILAASDGIMVARGDLGVEVPIEEMAILQKKLIAKANLAAKPIITATQMLESMTTSRLPTRAEATDVANAILDGTDCVMLSGESAVGRFPVEAVNMLARIAAYTENHRPRHPIHPPISHPEAPLPPFTKMTWLAGRALETAPYDAVIVPTRSGLTARAVVRSRPSVWILAVGRHPAALQNLSFSYGVHAIDADEPDDSWGAFARQVLPQLGLKCRHVMLVAGPSSRDPEANHRLEFLQFESSLPAKPQP
jgi:pyruvate kinase